MLYLQWRKRSRIKKTMKILKSILYMLWLLLLCLICAVILNVRAFFVLIVFLWEKLLMCLKCERNQKMIGQCKHCEDTELCEFHLINTDDFGCIKFEPQETLLDSEIVEWMQFAKFQERKTVEAVLWNKRKYIKHDDNCILVEKQSGDQHVIPIDDDYLDYAMDMLCEFIGDADFNDLTIGDRITFTFIRVSEKEYEELCDEN